MRRAAFEVQHAGPFITYQDVGRQGHLRYGVTASGPMDRVAFRAANLAVGNTSEATCIEISLGGLSLTCTKGPATVAVVGGGFQVQLGTETFTSGRVFHVAEGDVIAINPGKTGSWCYLAIAGGVLSESYLGATSTHALAGFGGGFLTTGTQVHVENARKESEKDVTDFAFQRFGGFIRAVLGPQDQHFLTEAVDHVRNSEFKLTSAYDRMGVQLEGPKLEFGEALSIPSEPILKGSVQVAGTGVPTVLLADHQTTGGYPKIATVLSADLDKLVQLRPRDAMRFQIIDPETAIHIARVTDIELRDYFSSIR